ncbi:MAG TPA: diadenylate cyclase CdaA [Gemmataceae bacterium]|nr:diadenylate cyclase CdaA [Gemmataceae bacterium]
MRDRLAQLYESVGTRDGVEIAILAVTIYLILRLLGKTRGAGIVRGLGLVVVGLFLVAQVVIASFDLTVLGRVLDYLLTTVLLGLLVIFQPELRRGLMVLGRYRVLRYFVATPQHPIADRLADAAEAMSRDCIGALIVIEREMGLAMYVETGQRIDGEVSAKLLRAIFSKRSPLHDGAVILCGGRISAAACQLPLGQPPENSSVQMGMRHRSALCMSEETDAVLLVVSEETGRISLAVGGRLEPVPRENLSRRLADLLSRREISRTRIASREDEPPRSAA